MKEIYQRSRPLVVWWNNVPAPYMVERFNMLADQNSFDFEAWFSDRLASHRSWEVEEASWRFSYRYIPVTRLGGRKVHWPVPLLKRRPDMLVCVYDKPSFFAGWLIAKLRSVKTIFWIVRTSDRWVARWPIKEKVKRWVFPRVDAFVTPGADGKQFAQSYGVSAKNVFYLPHAIDVSHYMYYASRSYPKRNILRDELGLTGTTFIYTGRLAKGKGLDDLLDAFQTVQQHSTEPVSLLLVGDGPEWASLSRGCTNRGLRNVVFAGFKQKAQIPRYYALADVFVFPTIGDPYGLVVDEAMACSLPVISTSAAGEIRDRIEDGVNGYIVPPEDNAALAEAMQVLTNNLDLRSRMGRESARKIEGHTPEKWARDFEGIVRFVLETRINRSKQR